jgi:hypothetical protein
MSRKEEGANLPSVLLRGTTTPLSQTQDGRRAPGRARPSQCRLTQQNVVVSEETTPLKRKNNMC